MFALPGPDLKRLPLNSIGDVLAGFFAPLAFLRLFVATELQRTELKLQREELADTRAFSAEVVAGRSEKMQYNQMAKAFL